LALTHEIAGDHHETVYSGFAPHAEKKQINCIPTMWIVMHRTSGKSTVYDKMVGDDAQHTDYTVEL
jgi:hypothetical protein